MNPYGFKMGVFLPTFPVMRLKYFENEVYSSSHCIPLWMKVMAFQVLQLILSPKLCNSLWCHVETDATRYSTQQWGANSNVLIRFEGPSSGD